MSPTTVSPGDTPADTTAPASPRWPWLLVAAVLLGFVLIVLGLLFLSDRTGTVKTDDAYVSAHPAIIAPRVAGQIESVAVDDNQRVRRGQLLAILDDRDYRTALAHVRATLARDQAQAEDSTAAVAKQPALIAEAAAKVRRLNASTAFAASDADRYRKLAATGADTQQRHQHADTQWQENQADLAGARAALDAAQHQLAILQAQQQAALATVQADRAQVAQAELNLSYTRILAPVDGMVGERSVQVGNYVGAGSALMALVPLDAVYIEANYREVALTHVRPGQPVKIHVDAYDIDLDGIVDSIPPASGAAFAPIAPENATGNFTKIVQRLPVKITLAPNQPLARLLRVGFSVETRIDTGHADVVGAARHGDAGTEPDHA